MRRIVQNTLLACKYTCRTPRWIVHEMPIRQRIGLVHINEYCFSQINQTNTNGRKELEELSQVLSEFTAKRETKGVREITTQIRQGLGQSEYLILEEFHKRLLDFYIQMSSMVEEASQSECKRSIMKEYIEMHEVLEEMENMESMKAVSEMLGKFFKAEYENVRFSNKQEEFEILLKVSKIMGMHNRDEECFLSMRLLEERVDQSIKQSNYEKYLESQCERVALSQITRKHDQTFCHLDILFREVEKLQIRPDDTKTLQSINSYYLRGILLSTQFEEKSQKTIEYETLQTHFQKKYDYKATTIEQLLQEVKSLSMSTPNYIQVHGDLINEFVEQYKGTFSKQVEDVLVNQLYNQVVPLNLFEYFYMLAKFEHTYREEVDEIHALLHSSDQSDLVDDFEELLLANVLTLLHIRRLIKLFTAEILRLPEMSDPFPPLKITSWITLIKQPYQTKIKQAFLDTNQTYL